MKLDGALKELRLLMGAENVLVDPVKMEEYKFDMADYESNPALVVRPRSEDEVVGAVNVARRYRIPIVARGGGSSLTGALVSDGSMVVDMRRMSRILKVDTVNWFVRTEPGISLSDLDVELKKRGFFFPPDPASSDLCTVGGAVSEDSGGMRCVKYGTVKDWVMSLRVVLSNGRVVQLGEPLRKNRAGLDLVHLFVGSEGTLGIIVQACLKVIPIPSTRIDRFMVNFDSWGSVGELICNLRESRVTPDLFEFLDCESIRALNAQLGSSFAESEATVIVDLEEELSRLAVPMFQKTGATRIVKAATPEESESIYQARAMALLAIKSISSGVMAEDIVVPIDRLGEYLESVKKIASRRGLRIPVGGHAGDGNIHPTILFEKGKEESRALAELAFQEMCRLAIQMGGSISGEHGIGIQKAPLLREQLAAHGGEEALRLMKEAKRLFDPENLMNPGKYYELA